MHLFTNRNLLYPKRPFVWAFIPDFPERGAFWGDAAYDTYSYKLELARTFRALDLPWVWQLITLDNLQGIVHQVGECMKSQETLVFNLCDGAEIDGWPGVSVIEALQHKRIAFTGADAYFYRATTSKVTMKKHFMAAGVPTPRLIELPHQGPIQGIYEDASLPLIVKPAISAGSYGIFPRSVVHSDREIEAVRDELIHGEFARFYAAENARVEVFAETFIEGPEFTVFVLGDWHHPDGIKVFPPIQRVFDASIPPAKRFLSFDFYWGIHKETEPPPSGKPYHAELVSSNDLKTALAGLARRAYCAVKGSGYARVDIRMDQQCQALYVLEVNSNCGLSGDEQTSMGKILELSGCSFVDLIGEILCQPLARIAEQE